MALPVRNSAEKVPTGTQEWAWAMNTSSLCRVERVRQHSWLLFDHSGAGALYEDGFTRFRVSDFDWAVVDCYEPRVDPL